MYVLKIMAEKNIHIYILKKINKQKKIILLFEKCMSQNPEW